MERALNSRINQVAAGIISLILAYILASLAIHTGRWLFYFLTFLALGTGLKLLVISIKNHGKG